MINGPPPDVVTAFWVITSCVVIGLLVMAAAAWFSQVIAHSPQPARRYRPADVRCIYHHDGIMWRAFVRAPERDCMDLPSTAKHQGDLY